MLSYLVRGGVCAAIMLTALPAWAMPFNVAQQNTDNIFEDRNDNNNWSARGTFNFDANGNGDLSDPGDEDGLTFSGGLFRLVENPTLQSEADFLAFCFEYTQFVNLPNDYVSQSFTDPIVAARLDALYTNAFAGIFEAPAGPTDPTQAEKAAAFQFALWEISIDPILDLANGRLELIGTETQRLFDLTADIIANLNSGAWVGDGRFTLEYLQSDPSQDLIRASAASTDVPLPSAAWMLLGALGALGWVRRRRES